MSKGSVAKPLRSDHALRTRIMGLPSCRMDTDQCKVALPAHQDKPPLILLRRSRPAWACRRTGRGPGLSDPFQRAPHGKRDVMQLNAYETSGSSPGLREGNSTPAATPLRDPKQRAFGLLTGAVHSGRPVGGEVYLAPQAPARSKAVRF